VKLYPAVDILGGSAVRLVQGDYDASTVYDTDPVSAARGWVDQGASSLHVVDLDGARSGVPANLEHLRRIAQELDAEIQYGGGLRSSETIADALRAGAARVVLGTAALNQPELLGTALQAHGPDRVLVSVDVRGGRAATAGWTQASRMGAAEAVEHLRARGVQRFIYTDVERDGMLSGPDLEALETITRQLRGASLIYSGGIGSLEHLRALAESSPQGLDGVIVGKALYECRFSFAQAQQAVSG
jgi:phosphoribosylformimino-5-aminoimidazole carboxamide ribotide isomerase